MPISRLDMGTREEITRPAVLRAAIAEFFSTLLFVFASRGSSISLRKLTGGGGGQTPTGLLISALSNSFALSAAVAASANTSGGHLNPAITFALFLGGHITLVRAILYIAAQLVASVAATLLLGVTTGADSPQETAATANAVVIEGLKTFGLVITVCAVAAGGKLGGGGGEVLAPLAIGFAVGANVLAGGSFDGAVMNPAATFGPAVVGWAWDGLWLCWAGQFVGGGLAGILYEFFFGDSLGLQNCDY